MPMPATVIAQYCNQRLSDNARLPNLERGYYLPNSYPSTSHLPRATESLGSPLPPSLNCLVKGLEKAQIVCFLTINLPIFRLGYVCTYLRTCIRCSLDFVRFRSNTATHRF